jgi:hypothetical protein
MPDEGTAALLVIDDGTCRATAEVRGMAAAVRMMMKKRHGGRWCAQLVDDGH